MTVPSSGDSQEVFTFKIKKVEVHVKVNVIENNMIHFKCFMIYIKIWSLSIVFRVVLNYSLHSDCSEVLSVCEKVVKKCVLQN